jgi:BASS family bile acid:Na+ symporter
MEINIDTIVSSYATITLFLLMLSVGLREGFENLTMLWRSPSLLGRCFLASFVLVPLATMAIEAIVPMGDASRAAIAVMALCPGAPMLYRKLAGMKANTAVAGSYQVTMSLLAVVFVPLWIIIINILYLKENPSSIGTVGKQIAFVQIIPITIGIMIRAWLPELADDWLEPVVKISSFMLLGALLIILVVSLPAILQVDLMTLTGVLLFITSTILIGHYLGGIEPENRITLALANSSRNAGLALTLVAINFDNQGPVLGAIGAIAMLSAVAGAIYVNLYRKQLGEIDIQEVAEG